MNEKIIEVPTFFKQKVWGFRWLKGEFGIKEKKFTK